jgi:hypothetical protein
VDLGCWNFADFCNLLDFCRLLTFLFNYLDKAWLKHTSRCSSAPIASSFWSSNASLYSQLVYFSKILGTLRFDLKQLIKPTLQELDIESIFLKQAKCTDLIQKKNPCSLLCLPPLYYALTWQLSPSDLRSITSTRDHTGDFLTNRTGRPNILEKAKSWSLSCCIGEKITDSGTF